MKLLIKIRILRDRYIPVLIRLFPFFWTRLSLFLPFPLSFSFSPNIHHEIKY
jgi:hypothetical protein